VYVVGAINGVEPLEDRNKKLQLCEIKSTFSYYYFSWEGDVLFSILFFHVVVTLMGRMPYVNFVNL